MENLSIEINQQPVACTFIDPLLSSPSPTTSTFNPKKTLLVFLNGLDHHKEMWLPTIKALQEQQDNHNLPAMLLYDRPGQGKSTERCPDPKVPGRPTGHSRDCADAASDLHALLTVIAASKFHNAALEDLQLVIVAASVSVAIARLYAQTHAISALLSVDSHAANSDIVSIFPDPEDAGTLPKGVTAATWLAARRGYRFYHPSFSSREGLWRGNLPVLLPLAGGPMLLGEPWAMVLEHDGEVAPGYAERLVGVSEVMTRVYWTPFWHAYQSALAGITKRERARGRLLRGVVRILFM